ncbi:hypothetical protein CAPTEDRAFT_212505 [Capitella teleta]|uniref:PLAC8-like protein 1 n=1 Tax=Capitella teleta TaxID=283909 RepID=R7U9N5_CAPTE|nr:hypothetical protein CAPTEDRAFT_212505 [Capitella teleta]|eukprot:ELU00513.1 hypothetical protein CAPTEDRAFT_212505 [Capitella teleta]
MSEWKKDICGCFDDFGLCAVTWIAPCVTAGQVAETQGKNCFLYGCLSMMGPIGVCTRAEVRRLIREERMIQGDSCNDCLVHWYCGLCALVQEGQQNSLKRDECEISFVRTAERSAHSMAPIVENRGVTSMPSRRYEIECEKKARS